jgi:hypothetical protein
MALAAVAVAAAGLTASCASAAPNRAAERASCTVVGRLSGAPPEDQAIWVREITSAPKSGNLGLDTAMQDAATALHGGDSAEANAEVNNALSRVTNVCVALGLWRTYQ